MVQKAIVVDLCDICQPAEVKAKYVVTANINGKDYALDMCEAHWDNHSLSVLVVKGRTDGPSPTGTKAKIPCPVCGKHYSKGSGMALHMKAAHRGVTDRVAV